MRNLKKFLALVLAMMMAMSLMVTANAAVTANVTYEDDYHVNEAFEEAVTVLSGMGVIKGYNGGETFMPKNNITRAEAATLVYRLATGDVNGEKEYLYTDYALQNSLTDVTRDKWYAGAVGYCANFGIVKGRPDGLFHANDPVTGYEILAMILRVVGYDKNGEFSGADWAFNVSTLATTLRVTDKVKTANYSEGGTSNLYAAATREVVASLLFETVANVPKVVYSPALGYMNTGMTGGLLGGTTTNPTVGWEQFGLIDHYGIVVGNEASGESKNVTKIGFHKSSRDILDITDNVSAILPNSNDLNPAYLYDSTDHADHQTLTFNWDSGLGLFNHAVKVWYNGKMSSNITTYAVYDEAKTAVVSAADADLAATGALAGAAKNSTTKNVTNNYKAPGFSLHDTDNDGDGEAFFNYGFARMTSTPGVSGYTADNWASDAGSANSAVSPIKENNDASNSDGDSDHPLYLLISNGGNALDVVITLDMTITQISQDGTTRNPKTTGVYGDNGTGTGYFDQEDLQSAFATKNYVEIAQKNLVRNSPTALNTKVAAIEITGTTGTDDGTGASDTGASQGSGGNASPATGMTSDRYYQLSQLTHVVPATVVNINYTTEEVFLSDGSSLKKSIFADAVDGSFKDSQYVNAPRVFTTYNFTLDNDGNYIYWEPITSSSTFVYGTYLDYQTEFTTSNYLYKMVGVDINGQQTIPEVTHYSFTSDPVTMFALAMGQNYDNNDLPKRDSSTNSGRMLSGQYVGYTLSDGKLKAVTTEAGGWGGLPEQPMIQGSNADFGAGTSFRITPNDALIGSVIVGDNTRTKSLYLTNDTMIYVVSGAGTGSQKVVAYKGLAELTKDMRSVEIKGGTAVNPSTVLSNTDRAGNSVNYDSMIYYSQKDFVYGQSYVGSAKAAEVVFIPAEAITFNKATSGNMYFVGDSTSNIINAIGEQATLFKVYQNGVESQLWIQGNTETDTGDAYQIETNGDNVFYNLVDSGKKTSNNQPIYRIATVADVDPTKGANNIIIGRYWADNAGTAELANTTNANQSGANSNIPYADATSAKYAATTYSLQSAVIDVDGYTATNPVLWNVTNAVVKNLRTTVYNIETLADLHAAGSLYDNNGVAVSCVLGEGYHNVTYIYVNK